MLKCFSPADLRALERRSRTRLVNALSGLRPIHLVGTVDSEGRTNLAPFNSATHIGADPPLIGLVFRPLTVERHTYENIRDTRCWTRSS